MSVTQTNLHQFFKVKKHAKHPLGKDGKQIPLKSDGKILNVKNIECKQEEANEIKNLSSLFPDFTENDSVAKSGKSSQSIKSEEVIAEAEKNAICVAKVCPLEKSEVTDLCEEVKSEEISTPKRKIEESEGPSRKRKRQQLNELRENDESSVKSTSSEEESEQEAKSRFAKRRLILGIKPNEVKKKLDPRTIKEQLGKCGRLDELRSRLLKLDECKEKLNAFKSQAFRKECLVAPSSPKKQMSLRDNIKMNSPVASKYSRNSPYNSPLKDKKTLSPHRLKSFASLDIEVPISPSKSPLAIRTPIKSSSERFSHLAEPSSNQLTLPHRYQVVKEVFRAVDTIVSLLHNRQEVVTYSKLKPAVQEMLRKTFLETQLGQLKTVFPLAYFFNQEKIKNSYNTLTSSYQLTVKPNLDYKKEQHSVSRNLMQELEGSDGATKKPQQFRKMGPAVLVERRDIFHSALLDILKKHHTKFLETLDPPIALKGPIYRWHPDFPLEEISPPAPSLLPQPPSSDAPQTAKDVLDKAKDIFSVNSRMQKAIETVASTTMKNSSSSISSSAADNKQVAAALKGISLSLLEKIRARETAKATREMTRSSGASKELVMLSRLPELVRILRSMFITEKKAALPWEFVMTKIIGSHSGSLSTSEAEGHVNLLMKELPGWCTSHKVRSGLYLKIDQARQLNDITDQLNIIIKERT